MVWALVSLLPCQAFAHARNPYPQYQVLAFGFEQKSHSSGAVCPDATPTIIPSANTLFSALSIFAQNMSGGLWLFPRCPPPQPGEEPLRAARHLSDRAGLDQNLTSWRDGGLLSSGRTGGGF